MVEHWLPVSKRFNQNLCSNAFTFLVVVVLYIYIIYINKEFYIKFLDINNTSRSSVLKLKQP